MQEMYCLLKQLARSKYILEHFVWDQAEYKKEEDELWLKRHYDITL